MTAVVAPSALDRFLYGCADELNRRAASSDEIFREGARVFANALSQMRPIEHPHSTVPVASALAAVSAGELAELAVEAQDEIPWIASHRMTDGGTEAALAPLNEARDFGDVVVGLLLLAAGATYPEHSHPPQEVYVPIAGGGEWRFGGSKDYRQLLADELAYNHPNDRHGIVAGDEPLLAMYILWGAGLGSLQSVRPEPAS